MRRLNLRRHFIGYIKQNLLLLTLSPPRLFAALVGVVSLVITVNDFASRFGWSTTAAILVAILSVFFGLVIQAFQKNKMGFREHELYYEAYSPPTREDKRRISQACCYFGAAAIDLVDSAAATDKDPFSTVILQDGQGEPIGFADYYCFTSETFDAYCRGRISIKDMFADHYLSHDAARFADVLYISTIFRYDFISNQSFRGRCETALLVWSLATLILEIQNFPESGIDIYSYGESDEGRATLEHFKFEKSGYSDPNGHTLLVRKNVQPHHLSEILRKYSFLGSQCHFTMRKSVGS